MTDNQLVAEADQLPELDEFAGMSIRDIALSITLWPEGSEDQSRAIAAIRARAPGIGHNRPPLAEQLDEDLALYAGKQAEMIEIAKQAVIVDDESAGKVTTLIAVMRTLERELDDAREKQVKPYLEAQRLINARYGDITRPLVLARQGEDGRGGLRAMLTAYDDKREAAAEAERQRLRAEAAERERQAAAARAAAEEKAKAGGSGVAGQLDALKAEDEADRLARRAEAIRPEPIRSHLGQVNRRRDIKFEIENLRSALGWLIKQAGLMNNIKQAAQTIIGSYLRGLGVDAVDRGIEIPGVKVWVEKGAANVRR